MSKLKIVAAIALCLPLAACFKEQEAKTAECQFKTQSVAGSPDKWTRNGFELMALCMKASGYIGSVSPNSTKCLASSEPAVVDPHCYVPAGTVSYWLDQLERFAEFYPATPKK